MFMMSTIDFQQYRKKQLSKKKQTITLTEGRILDYTDKNIQFIKKSIGLHELNKYEEGIEIALFDGMFHPKSIFIENNQFISIELYGGELLQEKQRSVLGRALVGGLLLGGIGAIVGGKFCSSSRDLRGSFISTLIIAEARLGAIPSNHATSAESLFFGFVNSDKAFSISIWSLIKLASSAKSCSCLRLSRIVAPNL
jgi:hypothetical protein